MGKQQDQKNRDEGKADESGDSENDLSEDHHDNDEDHHGEGHGNLKRRSDWFEKRHGGG